MKHTPKYCTNNAQPSLMSAVAGGSAAAVNPQGVYLFSVELLHVRVRIRVGVKFGLKLVSNFKNDSTNKNIYIYIFWLWEWMGFDVVEVGAGNSFKNWVRVNF